MFRLFHVTTALVFLYSCTQPPKEALPENSPNGPFIIVLGVTQDAGYPQTGCYEPHCMRAWNNPELKRKAVSLGLVDPKSKKKWLFEATPDIREQLFELQKVAPDSIYEFAGIFLTHGHMGHYTGLMHIGNESMNARDINVYAMPRMASYLSNDGPWSQLVDYKNIQIQPLEDSTQMTLTDEITVMPFRVPHREEYTEAVGYQVFINEKSVIFIPDIDKWHFWNVDLASEHPNWDYAFLDAAFFQDGELPGRDMSKIKHPYVTESYTYFDEVPADKKSNIYFIHFNHTNPLLVEGSPEQAEVTEKGFNYAFEGQILPLE